MKRIYWILAAGGIVGALCVFFAQNYFWGAPVAVRNRVVAYAQGDRVSLSADIYNQSSKIAKTIYVFVWAGALVEYELNGSFLPHVWTHERVVKGIGGDAATLEQHLSKFTSCYSHCNLRGWKHVEWWLAFIGEL